MKIAIITCHDVYNYGASLQAFALQNYLSSRQNDVHIIDYGPEYLRTSYSFWNLPYGRSNDKFRKYPLLHFLLAIKLFPVRFSTWQRIIPFVKFKKKYLKCTRRYRSFQHLQNDPPVADCYIAGSDQIWNTYLHNGMDPAFYLMFCSDKNKRIAYAASFAMPSLPEEHREFVSNAVSGFRALSVREKTGVEILESMGFHGELVVDPVFLLSRQEWTDVFNLKTAGNGEYILVYCLNADNKSLLQKAEEVSEKLNKNILIVEGIQKIHSEHDIIRNAGPVEFVRLISSAAYVITDSFHGTAFSILFEKPFYVYHKHSDASRITDLLDLLGLDGYINSDSFLTSFNWNYIKEALAESIAKSKEFLRDNAEMVHMVG